MKVYPNKVPKITAVFGVNPGYDNTITSETISENEVLELIQKTCEEYYEETGRYCSFVVQRVRTLYREEWGCPKGGEDTYRVESTPDPETHVTGRSCLQYISDCKNIILTIAKHFEQHTVRIEVENTNIVCEKYVM